MNIYDIHVFYYQKKVIKNSILLSYLVYIFWEAMLQSSSSNMMFALSLSPFSRVLPDLYSPLSISALLS
jgi:hypothetical protein